MCGISGYSGLLPPAWLSSSLQTLFHRGPDDQDFYLHPSNLCGLAHTRLSIRDLSLSAHQPAVSTDSRFILAYNGEIYNTDELISHYGLSLSSESSDTNVLFESILTVFGSSQTNYFVEFTSLISSLNGIFALALLDTHTSNIYLARDRFGVKPLYLYQSDQFVCFASEVKTFQSLDHTVDVGALVNTLTYLMAPGTQTISSYVSRLPIGSTAFISESTVKKIYSYKSTSYGSSALTTSNHIRKTEALLRQAVHRQLISDVPLGSFLSGGLDSTAIAFFAREIRQDLPCFTISVDRIAHEGFTNDLPYAEMAAEHLNLPLDVLRVTPQSFLSSLKSLVWNLDEPLADPAALNVLLICQQARSQGIKVLLSGTGGDDLFSGYRRHTVLSYSRFLDIIPNSTFSLLHRVSQTLPSSNSSIRRLKKLFAALSLPVDNRILGFFQWFDPNRIPSLLSQPLLNEWKRQSASDPLSDFSLSLPGNLTTLRKTLLLEQQFFLPDHNLLYTDKMSMATGVEVRVPFLDNDLVDFCNTLPDSLLLRHNKTKWLLRKVMEPYLPKEIVYRPKTGFALPIRSWLQNELKDWLYHHLSPSMLNQYGIFNPSAIESLLSRHSTMSEDLSYTLLSIVCVQLWCQHYIR